MDLNVEPLKPAEAEAPEHKEAHASGPTSPTFGPKRIRYKSLQRFLILVVVISVAFPATITGYLLIRENFDRTVEHDSLVMATNYIELLEAGMTMPLWNIAADLGQPLIDSVSIDSSIVRIHVKDVYGEGFLNYEPDTLTSNESVIQLERDVVYEGEALGTVELVYSLESAQMRAVNESRLLLTILISQLVFSIALVSFFLRRRVINPVNQLEKSAAGIAAGDLKTSIPAQKNDEFGLLSKQLEKMRGSLESAFETLEERVRERTSDLVDVNKELKHTLDRLQEAQGSLVQSEKLAALGALVAGVAHELNTPIGNGLTVASAMADATVRICEKKDSGMTRSALEAYLDDMSDGTKLVVASLDRASELVQGFKQVAMDRTSTQRRKFQLHAVLSETKLTASPAFRHTPYIITIDCDSNLVLESYPGPLGQIITNLLNNALIHAFDGSSEGTILVKAVKQETKRCILSISDDGKGIPPENLNRIFDPFFTTKLGEGGNGLGMHIVHNLVTGVLGGTIEVQSELAKGTTFIIDIPLIAPVIQNTELNDDEDETDDDLLNTSL